MSRGNLGISRWLDAYSEQNPGLTTLPGNVVLSDINGDGNYCLVITDIKFGDTKRSKMKVYKGTTITDITLPDLPNSLVTFYTDQLEPRIPAVAVACGSSLFIHKNNKPYFKFQLPYSPVSASEAECWAPVLESDDISEELIEKLKKDLSAIQYDKLSNRSQELLTVSEKAKIEKIVRSYNTKDIIKESPITCMTTLKKKSDDKFEVSCPVLATESGNIYILDPQSFTILHQANACRMKVTPFMMRATGVLSLEFRILVACREGYICVLQRGWLEGKFIIQMTHNIADFVVIPDDNLIIVATTDKILNCFSKRGHKLWSLVMSNEIICLCLVPLPHIRMNVIAVGLKNGAIHLYQGRKCVDQINVPDAPSVITFGQLGQEEHVLVIITIAGTVIFRILKRTADFNSSVTENVPLIQNKPLSLPKRSKLFLEQTMRERNTFLDIHQTFQQDLMRIRLHTAKELLQQSTNQTNSINQKEQVKLSAQVLGLGTKFTVTFTLENMETNSALRGVIMILHVNPLNYECSPNKTSVPLLQPGFSHKIRVKIEEIVGENQTNVPRTPEDCTIRVFITRKHQTQPMLAATVNMPLSENISL
ncbi:unnamed protein product [Phaedon cochleariae]|uniref:Bardet-Biedl syndrome 1 N-terminal domain-containing protein n=1 Tax=Phaedon cochleariae TaxID=80249 RepID=A0A9P0DM24_PHACE|nr:unnamed protein product [Phaedon cochleariae]